jgi:hypothetical protein
VNYFGDLLDGLDCFHSNLDLFKVLGGKAELALEEH